MIKGFAYKKAIACADKQSEALTKLKTEDANFESRLQKRLNNSELKRYLNTK